MGNLAALAASRQSRSAQFANRMKALAERVPAAVGTIARSMFIAGSDAIIQGTPTDTGRLRYGWNPSEGEEDLTVPPPGESFPDADSVVAKAQGVSDGAKPFPRLLLTNNVEYAAVLEVGGFVPPDPGPSKDPRPERFGYVLVEGGFSTKAPEGMLTKGVAAIAERLREFEGASESLLGKGAP